MLQHILYYTFYSITVLKLKLMAFIRLTEQKSHRVSPWHPTSVTMCGADLEDKRQLQSLTSFVYAKLSL